MARGKNLVILIGNLGQDPETRYMPSGGAVTNLTLATSETWKDKTSGQPVEKTEWHRLVFFNKLAEIAGEYLRKGSKIYAEGSLRTRKWQNKDGVDQYTTEIVVSEMQMLDGKNTEQQNVPAGASKPPPPPPSRQPARSATGNTAKPEPRGSPSAPQHNYTAGSQAPDEFDGFPDDDIPF